ncbi:hypothetical protein Sste5344_000534 [Sporothrix stenoceras]
MSDEPVRLGTRPYFTRALSSSAASRLESFRDQAILCNVRGTGEPHLEFDFPPGSDMVGEILAAPRAVQRMEFELFTRLGGSEAPQDND